MTTEQRLRKNARQRVYRAQTRNSHTKKYEKTPSGFLMRAYRNMLSRVSGVQKEKAHLYKGKEILSKEEFYAISRDDPEFWRLFRRWEKSGYNRKLCPSVNRVNPDKGYIKDNIEWITHSINSSLSMGGRRKEIEIANRLIEECLD